MLDCTIVGISQEMDFEQNMTVTYLVVRLPDGHVIRSAVDEEAAAAVVELQVQANGAPKAANRPPRHQAAKRAEAPPAPSEESVEDELTDESGNSVHIFGGQESSAPEELLDEETPEPEMPETPAAARAVGEDGVLARRNVQRTSRGKLVVPSKTVPKDDAGYPVIRGQGVDPDTLTSGRNLDEDGVGSV